MIFSIPFAKGRKAVPLACLMGFALVSQQLLAAEKALAVSPAVQKAVDLGAVDPSESVTLTVHLNMRNQAAFDLAVEKLYDPESATYHHWMTDADIRKYAPTEAELKTVSEELEKNGLSVIESDAFSVRVRGTAANVEKAFNTQLHNLSLNGKTFRAHISEAKLSGSAGSLVSSVGGLERHTIKPMLKRAADPHTGRPTPPIALSAVAAFKHPLGYYTTDQCLPGAAQATYVTPGASLPIGIYYGNTYVEQTATGQVCDVTPAQLQAHYGLPAAYKAGLNGKGQTIVLLEGYGYPTAESDANAFFKLAGLPLLDSSNFEIVYPEGQPDPTLGVLTGWDVEIALDIQWAHSTAPGAKIVVVASNGQDNEDFQYAMNYIVRHKLGTVVSDSWEEDVDILSGPQEQESFNAVLEMAAAQGVSFQFSSGDGGDGGVGTPVGSAGVPASQPYATAVGGTAILNSGKNSWEVGWGDTVTQISGDGVFDPPSLIGLIGGAGGGESVYFKKPAWQSKLWGTGRQVPDISALADPYTGVPLVVTQTINGVTAPYLFRGVGGTSLACPIVTGILAIATQEAGKPLGLAAPLIANLPAGAIRDVLPLSLATNLSGMVVDSTGSAYYSPAGLFGPALYTTEGFISANWVAQLGPDGLASDGIAYAFGFGIDSSLTVTKGWDNVTGYGVPNGLTFIKAMAK